MVAVDNSTLNLIVTGIQQTSTTLTSGTLRYITFNNIGDTQFMNVLDGNILRSNCTMTVTSQKMMFVGDVVATPGQIPYSSGSWAPAAASLTIVGTPTYTGKYTKIGSLVTCTLQVVSTTSTASTAGATFFNGLPYTPSESSVCVAIKNDGSASFGNGVVYAPGSAIYTPTWPATANVVVQFSYRTAS